MTITGCMVVHIICTNRKVGEPADTKYFSASADDEFRWYIPKTLIDILMIAIHINCKPSFISLHHLSGRLRTRTMTDENALKQLKAGLIDESIGFIYHCLNHYFCPIGYEDTPLVMKRDCFPSFKWYELTRDLRSNRLFKYLAQRNKFRD